MKSALFESKSFKKEYPFESHFKTIQQHKYHYIHEGQNFSEKNECALMIHGNPTWSFYYRNLIKSTSKKMPVIAPDHIGCGLSEKPQTFHYSIENHIKNLVIFIQELDLKNIHLIVHDWGGAIGLGAAIQMPKRIKSITILNTAAFMMPSIPFCLKMCQLPILGKIAVRGANAFLRIGLQIGSTKGFSKITKQAYLAPYNNWKNRIAILKFVQDIPLKKNHPTKNTLIQVQNNLKLFSQTPIKIFWGEKDFCFNNNILNIWKEYFPLAIVKEYKQAGHFVLEDAKDTINQDILHWLLNPNQTQTTNQTNARQSAQKVSLGTRVPKYNDNMQNELV